MDSSNSTRTFAAAAIGTLSRRPCEGVQPLRRDRSEGRVYSLRRQHELIAVLILEDRGASPIGFLRRTHELHAASRELLVRLLHVVRHEADRLKLSDAILVAVRREQNELRVGAGNL